MGVGGSGTSRCATLFHMSAPAALASFGSSAHHTPARNGSLTPAISGSPTFCRPRGRARPNLACDQRSARRPRPNGFPGNLGRASRNTPARSTGSRLQNRPAHHRHPPSHTLNPAPPTFLPDQTHSHLTFLPAQPSTTHPAPPAFLHLAQTRSHQPAITNLFVCIHVGLEHCSP